MAVMAAGMHLAGHGRAVREIGLLVDRQRVHVGPHGDDPAGILALALDDADDAGLADAGGDFVDAPFPQLVGDEAGGPMDVVHQLGVAMDVAADRGDFRGERRDDVGLGHRIL